MGPCMDRYCRPRAADLGPRTLRCDIYHSALTFLPEVVENAIDLRDVMRVGLAGPSRTPVGTSYLVQGGFTSPMGAGKNRIGCHSPQSIIISEFRSGTRYVSGWLSSVLVTSKSVRAVFAWRYPLVFFPSTVTAPFTRKYHVMYPLAVEYAIAQAIRRTAANAMHASALSSFFIRFPKDILTCNRNETSLSRMAIEHNPERVHAARQSRPPHLCCPLTYGPSRRLRRRSG